MNSPPSPFAISHIRGDTRPDLLEYTHYGPDGLTAQNLTGVQIRMQVRDAPSGTVLLERSSIASTILITPLTGRVRVLCPTALEQAAWTWTRGSYDLEYTYADGSVQTWVEAQPFVIKRDVTR